MTVLIDTHTLIWFAAADPRISPAAQRVVKDPANELWLSVASAWEIAIKVGTKKLNLAVPYGDLITTYINQIGIEVLHATPAHLVQVSLLPHHHRDPFDRLIVAQALVENVPVVSVDPALDAYGVARIW